MTWRNYSMINQKYVEDLIQVHIDKLNDMKLSAVEDLCYVNDLEKDIFLYVVNIIEKEHEIKDGGKELFDLVASYYFTRTSVLASLVKSDNENLHHPAH